MGEPGVPKKRAIVSDMDRVIAYVDKAMKAGGSCTAWVFCEGLEGFN